MTTMKLPAKIYYVTDTRAALLADVSPEHSPDDLKYRLVDEREIEVDLEQMASVSFESVLEDLYRDYNVVDGSPRERCQQLGIRSMMVLDVITIGETAWIACRFSWERHDFRREQIEEPA